MGLYLSIVIGFTVLLLITIYTATYFLRKGLPIEDSVIIDPIPTKEASSKETVA
ncbi:hypothetical protein ACFOZY_06920 [Chungangia koreensis]|uniref:Uncharacterized protein n=1 Tax=Chungangia koreensis TaxID=752657 RepID=A0ABV8X316_9LACT